MPTFAELRAKAEAAANSAKESAQGKLAERRGDKKPENPVYKAPPRRPPVKPPLPPDSSRPKPKPQDPIPTEETMHTEGYIVESPLETEGNMSAQQSSRASIAQTSTKSRKSQKSQKSEDIQILLQNKDMFFRFMDEFFASKGFNIQPRETPEDSEIKVQVDDDSDEQSYPGSESSHEGQPEGIEEVLARAEVEEEPHSAPLPVPVPSAAPVSISSRRAPPAPIDVPKPPQPPTARPTAPVSHQQDEHRLPTRPGRALPPVIASSEASTPSTSPQSAPASKRRVPPIPVKPRHLQSPPSSPEPTQPTFDAPIIPAPAPVHVPVPSTLEREDERTMTLTGLMSVNNRLANLIKVPTSSVLRRTPSTSTSSTNGPPPIPASTRPTVNRATRPSNNSNHNRFAPPPPFFTSEIDENWTPSLPYAYMPQAGRKVTEGQCSAAQLCSYFADTVPWDLWYMADDPAARPISIIERIEARWKGSVLMSQETKRRLFGSDKTSTEKTRVGVVIFQDLSIAWYRVTWKDEDPIKSLRREARYRAVPSPWNGDYLYDAHLIYGQAITDFCERAIRMRQPVGAGEAYDLASGALNSMAKYKPNAAPVIPSIGHCHGHLIYEGYVAEGGRSMWGATRGGESAIRNGDILQWCDAQFELQDEEGETVTLSVGETGYTSVILSSAEFPDRLDEDGQTLPPIRLPELEIAMQSVSSGMPPSRRIVWFSSMTRGRIWIYRCVGWDYVGLAREPDAEWPPPDPTLFLPS